MSTLHEELLISPDISLQAQIQNSQFICELASFKIPAWWGALAGLSAVESKLTYQLRPSNKNTKYLKYLWAFISPNSSLMRSLSESITNCGRQAKSKRDFCVISRKKCFFLWQKRPSDWVDRSESELTFQLRPSGKMQKRESSLLLLNGKVSHRPI